MKDIEVKKSTFVAALISITNSEHNVPRPKLPWGKGSCDYWAISWLYQVSSIDFERTLFTCLHDIGPISLVYVHTWMTYHYFIGLSNFKTVDSAQPRNCTIVARPFSSWEVGSGHETTVNVTLCVWPLSLTLQARTSTSSCRRSPSFQNASTWTLLAIMAATSGNKSDQFMVMGLKLWLKSNTFLGLLVDFSTLTSKTTVILCTSCCASSE